MSIEHTIAVFERQATACAELGSPLYAALLRHAATDIRDGGPCAAAVAGHEDVAGPQAVALRLMGGVHALVLTGRAPALAVHYPSAGGHHSWGIRRSAWRSCPATLAVSAPTTSAISGAARPTT